MKLPLKPKPLVCVRGKYRTVAYGHTRAGCYPCPSGKFGLFQNVSSSSSAAGCVSCPLGQYQVGIIVGAIAITACLSQSPLTSLSARTNH
jgi:hypothetical protein